LAGFSGVPSLEQGNLHSFPLACCTLGVLLFGLFLPGGKTGGRRTILQPLITISPRIHPLRSGSLTWYLLLSKSPWYSGPVQPAVSILFPPHKAETHPFPKLFPNSATLSFSATGLLFPAKIS